MLLQLVLSGQAVPPDGSRWDESMLTAVAFFCLALGVP